MDINKANEISSGQVYIFVITAQISFGVLSIGTILAEKVGHDGWITILLAGILVSALICIIMSLLKRFGNLSILDINVYLFGKFIGGFANWFLIGILTYTAVMCLRMFTDIIKISALKLSPGLAIAIFIILPTVYLSWYGLKYICRFSSVMPFLLIIIVLYYFLLSKYFRLTFLQPVGEAGLGPIFKNIYVTYLSYTGYEMLAVIYPHIKNKKKALSYALLGNLTTTVFYITTVVFLTGFFGEKMLMQLQFPVFSLARAYRAPVLERLDLFFITLWFPIMETVLLVFFYNAYYGMRKMLGIENSKSKNKLLLIMYTIIVIIASRLPRDMIQVNKLFSIVGSINTGYVGYIALCYFISFIKKPGGKKSEKTT